MSGYSTWLTQKCMPEKERLEILRELLSLAMLSPHSSTLETVKGQSQVSWASPLHWSRQYEWPWVIHNAKFRELYYGSSIVLGDVALDIGGCWSVLGHAVAGRCKYLTVTDIDPEAVRKGRESTPASMRMRHDVADARKLPYPDQLFDVVTCVSVLEHVPDNHVQCFQEMRRVLKPGGRGLVTMDVKLSGVRHNDSFVTHSNYQKILSDADLPLSGPVPLDGMMSRLPGDDGKPLHFTVLLIKFTKE